MPSQYRYREWEKIERESAMTQALHAGPLTAYGIAVMIVPEGKLPSRSTLAKVTQSLRVMEREKIVKRETSSDGTYWSLAR